MMRNKRLEEKNEELTKSVRVNEETILRSKSFDLSAVNENISLKKELVHSQRLIAENQQIM